MKDETIPIEQQLGPSFRRETEWDELVEANPAINGDIRMDDLRRSVLLVPAIGRRDRKVYHGNRRSGGGDRKDSTSKGTANATRPNASGAGASGFRDARISRDSTRQAIILEIPLTYAATPQRQQLTLQRTTNINYSSQSSYSRGRIRTEINLATRLRGAVGYIIGSGTVGYQIDQRGSYVRGGCRMGVGSRPRFQCGATYLPTATTSLSTIIETDLPQWNMDTIESLDVDVGGVNADSSTNCHGTSFTAPVQKFSISCRQQLFQNPLLSLTTGCEVDTNRTSKAYVNLQSTARHKWCIGGGWNSMGNRPYISLLVSPQITSLWPNRSFRLSACCFAPTVAPDAETGWTLQTTISQQIQSSASSVSSSSSRDANEPIVPSPNVPSTAVGVSVSHPLNNQGLCWIFSYTRGDLTIRVPIQLSTIRAGAMASTMSWWSVLTYPIQYGYISILSHVVQDIITSTLNLPTNQRDEQQRLRWMACRKSQTEAQQQQTFMEKQAKIRLAAEEKLNEGNKSRGLVIRKAWYFVSNGDEWDVTIPLQFFVSDSRLELPATTKRDMLGFYDVTLSTSLRDDDHRSGHNMTHSSWSNDFGQANGTEYAWLSVEYEYGGEAYSITIRDDEELILPAAEL